MVLIIRMKFIFGVSFPLFLEDYKKLK